MKSQAFLESDFKTCGLGDSCINPKNGRLTLGDYYSAQGALCKMCVKERQKEYYQKNVKNNAKPRVTLKAQEFIGSKWDIFKANEVIKNKFLCLNGISRQAH